jgi:hypothetical protein
MGCAVLAPDALPDTITTLFVGLNPHKAKEIIVSIPALQKRKLDYIWLG